MYTFIFSAQLLNGCAFNNPDINKSPVITDDVDSDGMSQKKMEIATIMMRPFILRQMIL